MSRAFLILSGDFMREKAIHWIRSAPDGTRLTFQEGKRTLPQNSRLWAMLTEVATQATHCGRKYQLPTTGKSCSFIRSGERRGSSPRWTKRHSFPSGNRHPI